MFVSVARRLDDSWPWPSPGALRKSEKVAKTQAEAVAAEMGWNADAIERQLTHAESNKVREAYTHAAQYLDEHKRMMQAWADYLDGLRVGGKVVAIKHSRS